MAAGPFICGYFLTLFFFSSQVWEAAASAAWDLESLDIKQGDDATITCTTANIGMFDVVRIEKRRIIDGVVDSDSEVKVTNSRSLVEPYKNSGRHEVEFTRSADKVATLKLKFKGDSGGIRGEDAGEYSCFALNDADNKAKMTISVEVPIEEVYLFQISTDAEGNQQRTRVEDGELTLAHGVNEVGVGCHASMKGSLEPIDDMKIKIDNIDETRAFKLDPEPSTDDTETNENGFPMYSSQKDLVYTSTTPSESFNGKKLVCSAHHGGKAFKRSKVTVKLNVEFPPKVSCSKGYEAYATVGGTLQIVCTVHANPAANVTWDVFNTTGIIDSPQEDGNIRAIEEPMGDDKVRATLNIQKVAKENIAPIELNAENRLGSHAVTVELQEGEMPTNVVSLNDKPVNPEPGEVKGPEGNAAAASVLHSWSLHLVVLTISLVRAITSR